MGPRHKAWETELVIAAPQQDRAIDRMDSLLSAIRLAQGRRCAPPRSGRQRRSLTKTTAEKSFHHALDAEL